MTAPLYHPITRLLVVKRGEIAIRVLQSVRELPAPRPVTYAIYTTNDSTHVSLGRPDHAIQIPSPASYTDISYLVALVIEHKIDTVHPGYGFVSESAEFADRLWREANCVVIGPGMELLAETGDKLKAKALAQACSVPTLRAMTVPTNSIAKIREFTHSTRFPIMVKAVDGGGGRGIRLVETDDQLETAVEKCIHESPSGVVFAEQAAVQGYKHIEVQILGDGQGGAKHFWERDCSVQRRFQKIVEVAPAPIAQRKGSLTDVIECAVMMAKKIRYKGLGTWEFLVNVGDGKFFFLEINPRLQVEHTITEQIAGVDLVKQQLLIVQGLTRMKDLELESLENQRRPPRYSIQLRLCAEDPGRNFAPSIGKVTDIALPSGNGIRVDSHLSKGGLIGSDFDNMMAKIIITAPTWDDALHKAQRALADTSIKGVKTNLNLLRGIIADKDFQAGTADVRWLESKMLQLVEHGDAMGADIETASSLLPSLTMASIQPSTLTNSGILLQKGDAWSFTLTPKDQQAESSLVPCNVRLDRISRNEFPQAFVGEVSYKIPGKSITPYRVVVSSKSGQVDSITSHHRRGDATNKSHIVLPMSGKLVEMLVEEGDVVKENEVIAYLKQMKMEVEVRSPRSGKIKWALTIEDDQGDDVAEGVLLAELDEDGGHPLKSSL
jgi:pyruvate carboxylase